MKLSELLTAVPHTRSAREGDPEITAVTHDSRAVGPGTLFCAFRGEKVDGRDFIPDAIARGAAAIVSQGPPPAGCAVPHAAVDEPRTAAALLAARLHGMPAASLLMVGITGTSGKTTSSILVDRVLAIAHPVRGLFGTLVYRGAGGDAAAVEATRTTPEATELQPMLAALERSGGTAVTMECSSHALVLDRLVGCRFDVAVFTNLSREHLDFHRDLEDYFAAKSRLFTLLKPHGKAVINLDDAFGRRLAAQIAPEHRITFSLDPASGADLIGRAGISTDFTVLDLKVPRLGLSASLGSPLLGRPNAENLLTAAAVGLALQLPLPEIARALSTVAHVPGRLERVPSTRGFTVLVDYAHKPAALDGVLHTCRDLARTRHGRVTVVFGCGGDRDRGKRPEMGRLAGELADTVVLTSDNPRSENPEAILDQIAVGLAGRPHHRIADRRLGIRFALEQARAGDVVLLAGKGHETYQETAGRKEPFDDRVVAAEELITLATRGGATHSATSEGSSP